VAELLATTSIKSDPASVAAAASAHAAAVRLGPTVAAEPTVAALGAWLAEAAAAEERARTDLAQQNAHSGEAQEQRS